MLGDASVHELSCRPLSHGYTIGRHNAITCSLKAVLGEYGVHSVLEPVALDADDNRRVDLLVDVGVLYLLDVSVVNAVMPSYAASAVRAPLQPLLQRERENSS